jgi:membrane protein required for colicin V production
MIIFDLIVIIFGAFLGFLGWRKGLIRTLLQLIGLIFAVVCAGQFYQLGARLVSKFVNFNQELLSVIGYVFVFLLVYMFALLIAMMLNALLRKLSLAWLDHGLGLLFGIGEAILILCVVIWTINLFPELKIATHLEKRSPSYQLLSKIEHQTIIIFGLSESSTRLRKDIRKLLLLPDDSQAVKSPATSTQF